MDKCTDLTQPTIESITALRTLCGLSTTWIEAMMGFSNSTVTRVFREPGVSHRARKAIHTMLYDVYLAVQDNIPEKCL